MQLDIICGFCAWVNGRFFLLAGNRRESEVEECIEACQCKCRQIKYQSPIEREQEYICWLSQYTAALYFDSLTFRVVQVSCAFALGRPMFYSENFIAKCVQ